MMGIALEANFRKLPMTLKSQLYTESGLAIGPMNCASPGKRVTPRTASL